jgi:hypothetical protein
MNNVKVTQLTHYELYNFIFKIFDRREISGQQAQLLIHMLILLLMIT